MPLRPARLLLLTSSLLLAVSVEAMARDRMGLGAGTLPKSQPAETKSASPASAFGARLAAVARRQTSHFVFYNPAYMKIAYPMGDVHKSGAGSGDTNIDHRRVEVLRRFFASRGTSLPITANPADYQPGDIVTYYMPDGWLSKTHIAIVAAEKSPTGVPLVVHNRGWGVQAENWLFAEKITGHFRYGGPR